MFSFSFGFLSFSCSISNSGQVGHINNLDFFFLLVSVNYWIEVLIIRILLILSSILCYRSLQELKIEQTKLEEAKREAEQLNDATDMKPEDAVSTTTPLYRQLLNAHAEESAVHEAIYYLGEAMKQEVIDCDVFLKQVRKMARRQFFLKATMNKCRKVAGLPV